mmetsp:Transcript_32927/g.72235  ORF Transcript_32927/g.72235 Transcript_32927/m.72235 type:complete len:88 (-) Transcript_32927:141-404(-)
MLELVFSTCRCDTTGVVTGSLDVANGNSMRGGNIGPKDESTGLVPEIADELLLMLALCGTDASMILLGRLPAPTIPESGARRPKRRV